LEWQWFISRATMEKYTGTVKFIVHLNL